MKPVSAIVFLAFALISIFFNVVQAEEYRFQSGDVLAIDIWGHDEFRSKDTGDASIIIRPDGKLSFPLAGEFKAAGLTTVELTDVITAAVSQYVIDPKVTVNVVKFHTTRIYVLGEVNRPGLYEIDKQHNLLDAIGMANGYTKDAAKRNIFIIHKGKKNEMVKANLLTLLKNGDMTQNYRLEDGDVVYLSGNGRIDFARDIMPWVSAGYYIHDIQK